MKKRSEIEQKYKWDLSSYYKTDNQFFSDFEKVKKEYKKLLEFDGKLNDEKTILKCFKMQSELSKTMEKLYVYANLKATENLTNAKNQEICGQIENLYSNISRDTSFISSQLNLLSDDFLTELSKNQSFEDYELDLKEIIKFKRHMLSPPEEKLLAGLGPIVSTASDVFDMIDSADIEFDDLIINGKHYELNKSNYSIYLESPDREKRKQASLNICKAYGKLNNTISTNYLGSVKTDCYFAKIRNFKSALDSSIFAEESSIKAYTTLISGVNDNMGVFHRYFELKRKALKQVDFASYDLAAPVGKMPDSQYTYEIAYKIVMEALSVLGEDYANLLKTAADEKWIDVMPSIGKKSGAYSWGAYVCNPVVFLNHENTINSVFTLAHELGHSMHSYFSNNNLCYEKAGYEIMVAEVASTVNEMLLAMYLLDKTKSKEEKLFYIDYLMHTITACLFSQTRLAEFEQIIHENQETDVPQSAESINAVNMNLMEKYFGKKIKVDEVQKYNWSRIPHFYTPFYVYKYATGIVSAIIISQNILKDEKNLNVYFNFLKSGCTKSPIDLLKDAGVDLESSKTYENTFEFINKLLNEMEEII